MRVTTRSWAAVAVVCALACAGCSKEEAARPAPQAVDVAALTVKAADVPIAFEYVGQTESSQQVEIRARVEGFLEKRLYVEGSVVKPGQPLFLIDRKPFDAQLDAAKAELAQQQARLITARANLARVKPLVAQNALSQKDLDDSVGSEQAAAAAVEAATAKVTDTRLKQGYTTIYSPVAGLSSFAKVQDGAYVNAQNSLLTYVAKLDPIRVNFSLSENELLRSRDEIAKSQLRPAPRDDYAVEVQLADGSIYPHRGRITFADAAFSQDTGTFLIRAELPNPKSDLRPGQFVRARVLGFTRPNAIVVPQRSIQQGPRGQFVWVVGKDSKAEQRPVEAGDWLGDNWIVSRGLASGEKVVVDGVLKLAPGAPLKVSEAPAIQIPTLASKLDMQQGGAASAPRNALDAGAAMRAAPAQRGAAATGAAAGGGGGGADAGGGATRPRAAGRSSARSEAAVGQATPPPGVSAAGATPGTTSVYFATASSRLDEEAQKVLQAAAASLQGNDKVVEITGYVDATGDMQRNIALARARAQSVGRALALGGIPPSRIRLKAPADIVGGSENDQARRVDLVTVGAQ